MSRSRSRSSSSSKKSEKEGVESITLKDADAAFILGKGGKTKEKIARVAGAHLSYIDND